MTKRMGLQTCLGPQNDRQKLSFLKDIYVVGKKMTRNDPKMAKLKGCIFYIESEYRMQMKQTYDPV